MSFSFKHSSLHSPSHMQEQIVWAREEGADFMVAETFQSFGEAKLALEIMKEAAPGDQKTCY